MVFPSGIPAGMPIAVPKLGIAAWLICDVDDMPESMTVKVFFPPGQTEVARGHQDKSQLGEIWNAIAANRTDGAQKVNLQTVMQFNNLVLIEPGYIEVVIETETGTLRAGRIQVIIPERGPPAQQITPTSTPTSPSSVSGPPSEQSPPDVPATKPPSSRRRPSTRRSGRTPGQE